MSLRAFACTVLLSIAAEPALADDFALQHVTVVDVDRGTLSRDQVVRIVGARIVEVGPAATALITRDTRVIDATDRFLIPGLWDMHTHLFGGLTPGCPDVTFPLQIAHGVTGVRDVGAHLDLVLSWRAEVESGRIVGPRIVGTGPLVDGIPVVYPATAVVARTVEDARQIVDSLARRGADFVKLYEMLGRDAFFAATAEASKQGLPVAAHVPLTVLAGEASDAGVRSFEHLRNLDLACSRDAEALLAERLEIIEQSAGDVGRELRTRIHALQQARAVATYDAERCTALLRTLRRNGTWQVPTLFMSTREARRPDRVQRVREALRWVPTRQRDEWQSWSDRLDGARAAETAARVQHAQWLTGIVRLMNGQQVELLAGTDISVPWMVPGAGLHEELLALADAGLTPVQVLKIATLNPARYFTKDGELGRISAGYLADLVVLDADPTTDPRNIRAIRAVISNGVYFDRTALDGLLGNAEKAARDAAHAVVHRPSRRQ